VIILFEDLKEEASQGQDLLQDVGMEDLHLVKTDLNVEAMADGKGLQVQVNLHVDQETKETECVKEEDQNLFLIALDHGLLKVHTNIVPGLTENQWEQNTGDEEAALLNKNAVREMKFNVTSATTQVKSAIDLQNALVVAMTATPV